MNSIKKGKVYTCQYPDGDWGVIVLPEVAGFLLLPLLLLFVPRFVELLDPVLFSWFPAWDTADTGVASVSSIVDTTTKDATIPMKANDFFITNLTRKNHIRFFLMNQNSHNTWLYAWFMHVTTIYRRWNVLSILRSIWRHLLLILFVMMYYLKANLWDYIGLSHIFENWFIKYRRKMRRLEQIILHTGKQGKSNSSSLIILGAFSLWWYIPIWSRTYNTIFI